MAEICIPGKRCKICPLNALKPDDQFQLFVDFVPGGAQGLGKIPPGEVGVLLSIDDARLGVASNPGLDMLQAMQAGINKRYEQKREVAEKVEYLRNNGLCLKP